MPGQDSAQSGQAVFFVRPHEIEINPDGLGLQAHVRDIRRYGAMVRLELERTDGGGFAEAVLGREEFAANGLRKGNEVAIQPKRIKLFEAPAAQQPDFVI